MKKTIGILAHVDAGKTTFSEQLLFHANALRTPGRVDHQDAFLDIHPLEKARGITIFSDQACFDYDGDTWYWVDTPGHVDFSSEMERALSVMDAAVLIISCVEGVQSHTETVWRLLERYGVPVFIFLNKTDRTGARPDAVVERIRTLLSGDVLDLRSSFSPDGTLSGDAVEQVAEGDEELLDRLFEDGYDREMWLASLKQQIAGRKLFPLMAGSALRDEGVGEFLRALSMLTVTDYGRHVNESFRARAFKVRFDAQGSRMVFMKVLKGAVSSRDEIETPAGRMKINELRIAHGAKFRQVSRADAGDIVAAVGLTDVKPGDVVGEMCERSRFVTEPLMAAQVLYPKEIHPTKMLAAMRQLEDEEPMLGVQWNEGTQSIELMVMGEIQLDVIRELAMSRFGIKTDFGPCRVRYMETIAGKAYGIGHYEPLRHYAEVHLKLEPGERGSGMTFESKCHVDTLSFNWQRLIESHVFERTHKGVLTGAPLTDVKVTLLTGRAHLKHTEGGDFRQATYRAIRNALMQADNVLMEPVCTFTMRAPADAMGRLLGDLNRMRAKTEPPEYQDDEIYITGEAVFSLLNGYQTEFAALTHGRGSLTWQLSHYEPCAEQEKIVEERGYRPLADEPADSVFCAKGAGFTVAWDKVRDFAHLTSEANP